MNCSCFNFSRNNVLVNPTSNQVNSNNTRKATLEGPDEQKMSDILTNEREVLLDIKMGGPITALSILRGSNASPPKNTPEPSVNNSLNRFKLSPIRRSEGVSDFREIMNQINR